MEKNEKKCQHKRTEMWDMCDMCCGEIGKCLDCGATYSQPSDGEKEFDD